MASKTSVDQEELNKFNKTAQQWWDENGEFKTLHQINPVRVSYITEQMKNHFTIGGTKGTAFSDLTLLDVGSGGGLISVPMHMLGLKVTGLDANEHNFRAATSHARTNKLPINFINQTVEQHSESQQKYDVILCLEVIEHVANPDEFLLSLNKMLAPGGLLIVSTINRTPKSYLLAIVMAEYVLGMVPKKTHNYLKFIRPSELVFMLKNTELSLKALKGLTLSVINNKWQLSDDIAVNYFATFVK
ncbi:MAG: bifunctional 3-demethylubiquinone 3-O-methyltransferase/2-octaprenyl-6-hydroxy phenol methylase [Rickettsiaceae bacterium]